MFKQADQLVQLCLWDFQEEPDICTRKKNNKPNKETIRILWFKMKKVTDNIEFYKPNNYEILDDFQITTFIFNSNLIWKL